MTKGLVSTIVLNWNGKEVIEASLESLMKQTYRPHEIIVVDNGSRDGSLEIIKKKCAAFLKLIENPKNFGFAEGVNQGIRASRGEFIALLNQDARAKEDWLENLMRGIQKSERVGMAACKIYLEGKKKVFDNTGEVITRDGLGRGRGRLKRDRGQYDREERVLCPSGCAALYRRKMLEEMGLLDKHFFAYAEDIDVGLQGRLLGYECVYIPSAVVSHRFSTAAGAVSALKAFYVERNRLWLLIKCFPLRHLLVSPFYTLPRYFYNTLGVLQHRGPAARFVKKNSFAHLLFILIQTYLSTLWFLPHLIRQRIQIQKRRRVPSREFDSWLKLYGMSVRDAALKEI